MDELKLQCGQVSNGKSIAVYTDNQTSEAMAGKSWPTNNVNGMKNTPICARLSGYHMR